MKLRLHLILAATIVIALAGCGDKNSGGAQAVTTDEGLTPQPIANRITSMEVVENLTEAAANELIEFSDAIRKRDFGRARGFMTDSFLGSSLQDLNKGHSITMPTGATENHFAPPADSDGLFADAFCASIEELLSPLASISHVFFKTRGAEFDQEKRRGVTRMTMDIIGRGANGEAVSHYGWAKGEVRLIDGHWRFSRFALERLRTRKRTAPLFTDVAEVAGMARRSPRLGKDGNTQFYWRGAAAVDVNGDGLDDVFTSTHDHNFLYINLGNGRFADRAKAMGLSHPIGPTTPLFLDIDNDGDMDLFMAFVGFEDDGAPGGKSCHLFENDGKGNFTNISTRAGIDMIRTAGFGASASDYDNDGDLDIYVCAYNRLDATYPDSWYQATNGERNLLLQNDGKGNFTDVAAAAGVDSTAWSYAAAWADFDGDGDQDFYCANDYGANSLYVNQGDGTFLDEAKSRGVLDIGNGMAAAWGDIDNDGDLDLYVSNMSSSAGNRILKRFADDAGSDVEQTLFKLAAGNTIFRQTEGQFEALPTDAGGIGASWAWGASFLDINLDGHIDIYVANGFISGNSLKDT
jgi:hypothetical protein